MSWTTHMLQELNIDFETDGSDADLCVVNYKRQRMFVRLSVCRITPIGVDVSQTKRLPLLDRDCIPKYDLSVCKELARIIMRGTHNHSKTVWVRNQQGVAIGLK